MPRERVGSGYKLTELIQRELGGEIWPVPRNFARTAERVLAGRGLPELAVVRGDRVNHYEACQRAGVPYLLLEHDIATLREPFTGYEQFERARLEGALGVIFTSEDHLDYCRARYKLPTSIVIHLRPLRRMLGFKPATPIGGRQLVYAGGLTRWRDRGSGLGYRAYHAIFAAFQAAGWTVHAYGKPNEPTAHSYRVMGVRVHPFTAQRDLYAELSRYTAGFLGYNREGVPAEAFAYTQLCRPNKTWEYLAAGIPTIAFQAGNTSQLVNGWGAKLENLEHLDAIELPRISPRARLEQTMDNDRVRLVSFLEEIGAL